jgi:hypothetical protein
VTAGKAAAAPAENNWIKTGAITTTVAPPAPKPESPTASWGDKVQVSMAPLPTAPPVPDAPVPQTSVAIAPAQSAAAPTAAAPVTAPAAVAPATATPAAAPPAPVAATPVPAAPLAEAPAAPKDFHLQIATLPSRSEAFALSVRLTSQYGGEFGRRKLQVSEMQAENQARAYRIWLGPYGNADEPQRVCTSLRAAGYECLVE